MAEQNLLPSAVELSLGRVEIGWQTSFCVARDLVRQPLLPKRPHVILRRHAGVVVMGGAAAPTHNTRASPGSCRYVLKGRVRDRLF